MNKVIEEMKKVREDCNNIGSMEGRIVRILLEICTDIKMIKIINGVNE